MPGLAFTQSPLALFDAAAQRKEMSMNRSSAFIGFLTFFVATFGGMEPLTSAHAAPKANLALYLPLDEGKGNEALDASGNKHVAQFVGSPKWTTGKIGSALLFDGSSSLRRPVLSRSG